MRLMMLFIVLLLTYLFECQAFPCLTRPQSHIFQLSRRSPINSPSSSIISDSDTLLPVKIFSTSTSLHAKITPNDEDSMDDFRKNMRKELEGQRMEPGKLGGRELLEIIIKKWGVAYDVQLRKSKPFGEGSENVYVNIMWRYFGQKSFPMNEREYMEHLEAIGRYITAVDRVPHFLDKVKESRKRPNAYFGYAVGIPLDVDYATADKFFKDLPYE